MTPMMDEEGFREHWVRCDCHTAEHSLLLSFDPDDGDDGWLYVQPCLADGIGFWGRLKYLFGYQQGGFTELVLRDRQAGELVDFVQEFRNRAGIRARADRILG
jgi:hypothetical protein